ncbi:hypothetical protein MNVM_05680 [Mycobacterium novum]|nr:hypothetical protein MNVM_05680 [Mycobacterium novum]
MRCGPKNTGAEPSVNAALFVVETLSGPGGKLPSMPNTLKEPETVGAARSDPVARTYRRRNGAATKWLIPAMLAAVAVMSTATAHADPAGDAICRLLAAGNTPSTLESSVTVRQVLGPDATPADARVYIRSVVAGQCPQYLWRW